MKKFLLIGSILLVLGLLIVGLATPIFAHSLDDGRATPADEEVREVMHEACEEVHGEDFDDMPCHDENTYAHTNHRGSMGGHMGRGMMGW